MADYDRGEYTRSSIPRMVNGILGVLSVSMFGRGNT